MGGMKPSAFHQEANKQAMALNQGPSMAEI
jgi:hypothetical protein